MEARSAFDIERKRILMICGTLSAVIAMIAVLMRCNPAIIAGIFTGTITGAANFMLLARTIKKIVSGENTAAQAKHMMKLSYAARLLMMAGLSVISIAVIRVNPLAHALLMPLPGVIAKFGKAKT